MIDSADPTTLARASAMLEPGESPALGILLAAERERLGGPLSDETVGALRAIGTLEGELEVRRLVRLADANDDDAINRLETVSPANYARLRGDDWYQHARWADAAACYEYAAKVSTRPAFVASCLCMVADCHIQRYRDGHAWTLLRARWALRRARRVRGMGDAELVMVATYDAILWPRRPWRLARCADPVAMAALYLARGMPGMSLAELGAAGATRDPRTMAIQALASVHPYPRHAVTIAGRLPPYLCGVAMQVYALAGEGERAEEKRDELSARCHGVWRWRKRELIAPREVTI